MLEIDVQTLNGLEPLGDQFGVCEPKCVPDALDALFFGNSSSCSLSLSTTRQTYAVLDAAKVINLPEALEASGLEHRCLFKGSTYDDLKDVAPWVVRLERGNAFTRSLFTRSSAPWHLWDSEPGIYIRSSGTLDDIWGHFRKFTRIQDEQGKWYYLRAFDPRSLIHLIQRFPAFATQFLVCKSTKERHEVMLLLTGSMYVVRAQPKLTQDEPIGPLRIGDAEREVFREITYGQRADDVLEAIKTTFPTFPIAQDAAAYHSAILSSMLRIHQYGFTQPIQQERFAIWDIFYGAEFEKTDTELWAMCCSSGGPAADRYAGFTRRMREVYP